jgi:hypothetical protein
MRSSTPPTSGSSTGAAAAWLRDPAHAIEEIRFVLFDPRTPHAFETALDAEGAGR